MYTNYLPELLLDLGDYGDVTTEGEFIKSGNIFKDYPSLRDEAETCKQSVGTPRHLETRRRKNTFFCHHTVFTDKFFTHVW